MNKSKTIATICLMLLSILGCQNNSNSDALNAKAHKISPENLLLKDWMPKSIYEVPITHIGKARFPVIDMHAHDYTATAEDIAERVLVMDKVGIQKSVIFTNATGEKFDSVYSMYSEYPDRFDVYCGFDLSGYQETGWSEKAVKELRRCVKEGAVGVGELHDKGGGLVEGLHPDNPRMDPYLKPVLN